MPSFKKSVSKDAAQNNAGHWFEKVEDRYGRFLEKILPYKGFIFIGFIVLFFFSGFIVKSKMKFVMFPGEETRSIVITGYAALGT